MIKLNKKNAIPFIRERLEKIYEVTHYYGDSYDTDLMVRIGKKREYLDDEAIFMTLDEYKDNIIVRRKWDYEGGRIVSANMFKGCNEIDDDDWNDNKTLSKEGVIRILNDIIHFLNVITKTRVYNVEDVLLDLVWIRLYQVERSL